MSTTSLLVGIFLSLVAILGSAWVIRRQLLADKRRREEMKQAEERLVEGRKKRIESIQVLLSVVGSDELGWMEASIRVKTLLDQLSIDLSDHDSIKVFYQVYAETEHIPTHEAWNNLPKEARQKFRMQMMKCEAKYLDQLEAAKKALLQYPLM